MNSCEHLVLSWCCILFLCTTILQLPAASSFSYITEFKTSQSKTTIIRLHGVANDRRNVLHTAAWSLASTIGLASMVTFPKSSSATSRLDPRSTSLLVPSSSLLLPNAATPMTIPRVGYSFYKTDASQVESCVYLALAAGVRHFDVGSMYSNNDSVGSTLANYILTGFIPSLDEKYRPILPSKSQPHDNLTIQSRTSKYYEKYNMDIRRKSFFISHKISNDEQSTDPQRVRDAVFEQMKLLKISYLDMLSIHSPLTDPQRRLNTYQVMVQLQKQGFVRCVGVCNYGVGPLEEIINAGLPAPAVIQLELSPFNQHKDVVAWATKHGSVLSCAAWSKLSSVDGPQDGWAILAGIAKLKGMTKAQVLVRWALQRGYICVPRSGSGSKIERMAIFENSFDGVKKFMLTSSEMELLNSLDEHLKAGKLGRRDGWDDSNVVGPDWDPTTYA